MEPSRFDDLSRAFGRGISRRSGLAAVRGAALGLLAATWSRDVQARDDCRPTLKRGEECEKTCQCHGDYRCAAPRPLAEREECGQVGEHGRPESVDEVCCLGQGDSCGENDCACCGRLVCQGGRCRDRACSDKRPCSDRTTCLASGSCAIECRDTEDCEERAPRCGVCSRSDSEDRRFCLARDIRRDPCEGETCRDHEDCPVGTGCIAIDCRGERTWVCVPLC